MTIRRQFTGDFKAKVALEALRGDKTIQEIAGRHKVRPNSRKRSSVEWRIAILNVSGSHFLAR
jgi:transposase